MVIEALSQATAVSPNNVPLLRLLAEALADAFKLDEARATYDRILVLEPEDEGLP